MIQKTRYIIQHKSGHFINLHYEPIKPEHFDRAARFNTEEEANHFYRDSHYRAPDPQNYRAVPMTITYELEVHHEQGEALSKNDRGHEGSRPA